MLEVTGCDGIETTVPVRKLSWMGSLMRMNDGRLSKWVIFETLELGSIDGMG